MLCYSNGTDKKFKKLGWVFYGSPLNPMSLTCGLTAAEVTQGKVQGKVHSTEGLMPALVEGPEVGTSWAKATTAC